MHGSSAASTYANEISVHFPELFVNAAQQITCYSLSSVGGYPRSHSISGKGNDVSFSAHLKSVKLNVRSRFLRLEQGSKLTGCLFFETLYRTRVDRKLFLRHNEPKCVCREVHSEIHLIYKMSRFVAYFSLSIFFFIL